MTVVARGAVCRSSYRCAYSNRSAPLSIIDPSGGRLTTRVGCQPTMLDSETLGRLLPIILGNFEAHIFNKLLTSEKVRIVLVYAAYMRSNP